MDFIDLHTHTTYSDGSDTPTALVALAKEINLAAIAITDHDNVDGLAEGLRAGQDLGLEVVGGVEISAQYAGGTMHILGYFLDPGNQKLGEKLKTLQAARKTRNAKIVKKMQQLGADITYNDVVLEAGGEQIGRPHFAMALVNSGFVSSIAQAFERYLGKGQAAYVEKFRFNPSQALAMIREAGGLAALGHPHSLKLSSLKDLEDLLIKLKREGLVGLEAYYPEHTDSDRSQYIKLAKKLDLVVTGGTDFHGQNKPNIALGWGKDANLHIPYQLLTELKAKRSQTR